MGVIGVSGALLLFFMVAGFLACFFGYRLFRILLTIMGFVVGSVVAGFIIWNLLSENQFIVLTGGLVGGLLGAFLLSIFYFFGIFITGALLGVLIASLITSQTTFEPAILVPIVGLILGLAALALQKYVIIVSTSVGGAWMLVATVMPVFQGTAAISWEIWSHHTQPPSIWGVIAWIILSLLGLSFQLHASEKKKKKGKDARRDR